MTAAHDHNHSHPHSAADAAAIPERPRKQEQFDALEGVTEVAPGVLRAQLPISMPGLGHVNCYVLEDERGVAVVDPGLPGPDSYRALESRLHSVGIPISRVHTVIVTHSHPDHFGGAGMLRKEHGADIVAHRSFRLMWDASEADDDVDLETLAATILEKRMRELTPWGGQPPMPSPEMLKRMQQGSGLFGTPPPSRRLEDAETIRLGRRDWVAVHTPGHTADHLCLFDPEEGVLLSGDHVLPTITPHISGLVDADDPLQLFFDSLDKVSNVAGAARHVLPAHGLTFDDVTARAQAIKEHHVERLARLSTGSAEFGRFASVTEFSGVLFSPRAQGSMADSETYAHLEHLRLLGQAERREVDGLSEYLVG